MFPYRRIYIEIFNFVSRFATKFLSHVREYFLKMWNVGSGYVEIVWPHCVVNIDDSEFSAMSSYSLNFHGNSEDPGLFLLQRVSSYSRPFLHLFATLEKSTLLFYLSLSPRVSPYSLEESNLSDKVL